MSSVQYFKELISERLSAAAEEIFSELEKTIVQYEEVIGRQRRLLDISWSARTRVHRGPGAFGAYGTGLGADVPQQRVLKQQFITNQWFWSQRQNHSQQFTEPPQTHKVPKEPEPMQIKQEAEPETCEEVQQIRPDQLEPNESQTGDQLVLVQEDGTVMLLQCPELQAEMERQLSCKPTVDLFRVELPQDGFSKEGVPIQTPLQIKQERQEPKLANGTDFRLLEQLVLKQEPEPVPLTPVCEGDLSTDTCSNPEPETGFEPELSPGRKEPVRCEKVFRKMFLLKNRLRVHQNQKSICGLTVCRSLGSRRPERRRTYPCRTCRRRFFTFTSLQFHLRKHTAQNPRFCQNCGECSSLKSGAGARSRSHSAQNPRFCQNCGECSSLKSGAGARSRSHSAQNPRFCQNCGECSSLKSGAGARSRSHSAQNPRFCHNCGKSLNQCACRFWDSSGGSVF